MSCCGHKSVRKGKRVYVRFSDGTSIIDRFVKRDEGYVYLENAGKIKDRKIKTVSIYKQPAYLS